MSDETYRLKARIEVLEAEVEHLRDLLAPEWCAPSEFNTTRAHDRILSCLLKHDRPVRDEVLWKATRQNGDYSAIDASNVLKVQICHLRRKLQPFGMVVRNAHGKGYYLSPESRQRLLNWNAEPQNKAA